MSNNNNDLSGGAAATRRIHLGFRARPLGKIYVFVGAGDDPAEPSAWYTLSDRGNRMPIYENILVGYIRNIIVVPKIWKGKTSYKVDITVSADEEYVIRSGVDTSFSKGVVNGLTMVEDLSCPIAITATRGDEENVVWGNVVNPVTGKRYYCESPQEKLSPLIFDLQSRLGVPVQTPQSIKQDLAEIKTRSQSEGNSGGRRAY